MESKKIPNILWPKTSGLYKIVQFVNGNQIFLRSCKHNNRHFHSDIIEKFADEINVKCVEKQSKTGEINIPYLPESSEYKVVGMGNFYFGDDKTASFTGEDLAYGMRINIKYLRLIEKFSKGVGIYNTNNLINTSQKVVSKFKRK